MVNDGNELYHLLIQLTGLEEMKVRKEIDPLLRRLGLSPHTLTMDDVRRAMIVYLDEFSAQMASHDEEDDIMGDLDGPVRVEA